MESPTAPRFYALDALRGLMMLLGVVIHAAMFYLADPPFGLVVMSDAARTPVADLLFHTIHSFRMPVFFMMAGFFAALLLAKRGPMGYFKNRIWRVLVPLLIGLFTILPVCLLFSAQISLWIRFGVAHVVPDIALLRQLTIEMRNAGLPVDSTPLMHLWFLYKLMLFSAIYAAAMALCRHVAFKRTRAWDLRVPHAVPVMAALLGCAVAISMWPFPSGQILDLRMGFIQIDATAFVHYGLFFVIGLGLYRHRECALPWMAERARGFAILAALVLPVALWAARVDLAHPTQPSHHIIAVLAQATLTVSLSLACIGGALRAFAHPSPWVQYASRTAYWFYLVHLPLCMIAAWALLFVSWPALVKMAVIIVVVTGVAFLSFHSLVQGSWIGQILNGCRRSDTWPWQVAGSSAQGEQR